MTVPLVQKSLPNSSPCSHVMGYPVNPFLTMVPNLPVVSSENLQSRGSSSTQPRVENAIGTVKVVLEKAHEDGTDPYVALLEARNTPIT